MGSYIQQAKDNIRKIAEKIQSLETQNAQYGLVCYRDHPPQDKTYATKTFPLTPSIKTMQENINTMSAAGGGDGPESVSCALKEVLDMDYRKGSVRVCVLISDAPPHGIGESGDGFPNGCPCGVDPLEVAHQMVEKEIVVYCVGVEPIIGTSFKHARAFYKGIADITHGRYLSLANAHLLPEVIVGGTVEEMDLKNFEEAVVKEVTALKSEKPEINEEELNEKVAKKLEEKGVRTWKLEVTEQNEEIDGSVHYTEKSLKKAVECHKAASPSTFSSSSVSNTKSSKLKKKNHQMTESILKCQKKRKNLNLAKK